MARLRTLCAAFAPLGDDRATQGTNTAVVRPTPVPEPPSPPNAGNLHGRASRGRTAAPELIFAPFFTSTRKGTNKQRRYLVGAFGAIPRVDTTAIRRALASDREHVQEAN